MASAKTSKLAIEGGRPIRSSRWFPVQRDDDKTLGFLKTALKSQNWSNGEQVAHFEQDFASFLKCEKVLMTVNATMALKLTLLAFDIGVGDEIIVPALTFPSIAMTVMECGATPVICDVKPETYCMSAAEIKNVLTERTRAVIPTHLYCTQCDMPSIVAFAKSKKLLVIEDCAHAPGATLHGKSAGTWGDAAIFSFNQKKPLSCGEGGCVVTNDPYLHKTLKTLRDFDTPIAFPPKRMQRMAKASEFQAAVLRGQLTSLSDQLQVTEERGEHLRERICNMSSVEMLPRLLGTNIQTFYSVCLRVAHLTNAAAFRRALGKELGMQIGTTYVPLDIEPALDCSDESQYKNRLAISSVSHVCANAHNAYKCEAVRFPGHYLNSDANVVNDIVDALSKVIPHFSQTR